LGYLILVTRWPGFGLFALISRVVF
jgi:hypothetical protein